MIPRDATGRLVRADARSSRDAHEAGLDRARLDVPPGEPVPAGASSAAAPTRTRVGDLAGEIRAFLAAGMDGMFTDNPDVAAGTVG